MVSADVSMLSTKKGVNFAAPRCPPVMVEYAWDGSGKVPFKSAAEVAIGASMFDECCDCAVETVLVDDEKEA